MQMVLRKYRLTTNNLQQSMDSTKPTVRVDMMGSNAFEREFNMTQGHGLGDGFSRPILHISADPAASLKRDSSTNIEVRSSTQLIFPMLRDQIRKASMKKANQTKEERDRQRDLYVSTLSNSNDESPPDIKATEVVVPDGAVDLGQTQTITLASYDASDS